jgi:hypothetical protein
MMMQFAPDTWPSSPIARKDALSTSAYADLLLKGAVNFASYGRHERLVRIVHHAERVVPEAKGERMGSLVKRMEEMAASLREAVAKGESPPFGIDRAALLFDVGVITRDELETKLIAFTEYALNRADPSR